MRLLGVGLFILSGCGLLIDVDPPSTDGGGPRPDAGTLDGATPDILNQPDVFDAGFDVPPYDGGPCNGDFECEDPTTPCIEACIGGTCDYRFDEDEDGICDAEDCIEGQVTYPDMVDLTCSERTAFVCKNSQEVEVIFNEAESCNRFDDDCTDVADDLPTYTCGVGACRGERSCGQSCRGVMMALDDCTPPGAQAVDEDCDGRIDEDCDAERSCTIVSPTNSVIDGPGPYCFVLPFCGADLQSYSLPAGTDLTGVQLYGDMYRAGAQLRRCPRGGPPKTVIRAQGTMTVSGGPPTHAESIRFALGDMAPGPVIEVTRGSTFRGYGVEVFGGASVAVVIDDMSAAHFGSALIRNNGFGGHTIDSQGTLTIDASCPLGEGAQCEQRIPEGELSLGVHKRGDGGSAIYMHGPNAILRMNEGAVLGSGATAIEMAGGNHVALFDSLVISQNPTRVGMGSSASVVSLAGCDNVSTFRNSYVINDTNSTSGVAEAYAAVETDACVARFYGAETSPLLSPHFIGSTGAVRSATGIHCGSNCLFEGIFAVGFDTTDEQAAQNATGIQCDATCNIMDSRAEGSANANELIDSATALSMVDGRVLRSELFGGNALTSIGAEIEGTVTIQDSVVVGLGVPDENLVVGAVGIGMLAGMGSRVGVLHSTIAGRQWADAILADGVTVRGAEVANLARIVMMNSILLGGPAFDSFSYTSPGRNTLEIMESVGLRAEDEFFVGSTIMVPFTTNFILREEVSFQADYQPRLPLRPGQSEMVTTFDITGARRARGTVGAYD